MSASLVGSEMCIRDRATLALANLFPLPDRLAILANQRPRRACALVPSCLLYTSDAADDMQ
eukprot:8495349-Alexandrium_andersonii.AAC.1